MKRKITLAHLHQMHQQVREHPEINKQMAGVYLAFGVLNEVLGEKWVLDYLPPEGKKRNILMFDESDIIASAMGHAKIIDLAEILYNLQAVEGIDECVGRLRRGDIEGALAELNLGRMLFIHDIPLKYVVPIMEKKHDYDMLVQLPNGMLACADAKCKIEGSEFSAKSLENTLKKGRKQFPDDKPAILFVKHPYGWHDAPDTLALMRDISFNFFRTTEKVVSVKFYVEPILREGEDVRQRLGFKEFSNPKTRFGNDVDWSIFNTPNNLSTSWQRLGNFPDGIRA